MLTVDARSTLHTGVRAVNPHFINPVITFRVSRRQREMYRGHARLCVFMCVCVCVAVCLSVRSRMPTLLYGPGCNLGEW